MNILLSAYKKAFDNYFNIEGRCSKSEYWGFMLTNISIIMIINILSQHTKFYNTFLIIIKYILQNIDNTQVFVVLLIMYVYIRKYL